MSGPTDPVELWTVYARHAEAMLSAGPAPSAWRRDGSFIAFSGGSHVDLNQAAIFGDGDRRDAQAIVETAAAAEVPVLLAVSSTVRDDVSGTLLGGGFVRALEPELLFFGSATPPVEASAFEVRRARSEVDHAGIGRLFVEAHGYEEELVRAMWGPALLDRPDVGGWVAWEGDEPVSCVFVTRIGTTLSFFDMQTPPRHRRRGAARAVLTHALAEASAEVGGADSIVFWSTPLGRPFYESLGFVRADALDVWTLGASAEDMANVGAG